MTVLLPITSAGLDSLGTPRDARMLAGMELST